jgi:hypothetical protein
VSRVKRRIEHRLNIMYGVFRTPVEARQDFRLFLRIGAGKERRLPNIELAVGGFSAYFGRVDWAEVEANATTVS